jgi:fermentation-respiration switch protein FrsA (DUF1100 family)
MGLFGHAAGWGNHDDSDLEAEGVRMRRDVTFLSKGLRCAGWLFVPDDLAAGAKAPAIVVGHGFGGIKEMYLSNYAEPFAAAGFVTLVFDYRYMGESEGEPRCQQLPWDNQEDYRNAISWLSLQPEVDPDRIGIWGTSYSGAHVIQVAAFDKRVKAVVNQANGTLSSLEAFGSMMGREGMNGMLGMMLQARVATYESGAVAYLPFVAPPGEPAAVDMPEAYEFFMHAKATVAPTWDNRTTGETMEKMMEGDLTIARTLVSPAPILVVLCAQDVLVPAALAREKFATMGEPKKLVELDCGHMPIYNDEPYLSQAVEAELAWFKEWL